MLAVTAVRGADGVRVAASGVGDRSRRLARGGVGPGRRRIGGRCLRARGRGLGSADRRAGVGLVPGADAAAARAARAWTAGLKGRMRMHLTVNGVEEEIRSDALTPLLRVLREELHITSPKAGCEQGGCGACTVLVDGEPRRSCLTPLVSVEGAEVTTRRGPLRRRQPGTDPARVLRPLRGAVRVLLAGHDDGVDRAAERRRRMPRASRSWRRSRATSAAARATSRSSPPSNRFAKAGSRYEGRRRTAPPLRRDRARHRAHAVRGRLVGSGHARLQGPALAAPQRAHPQHRHVERREASRRDGRRHAQGHAEEHRRPSRGARRPGRRAVPRRGRGALQGPAHRRRGGDRRGHGDGGARA